jgi:hypothetical protein
MSLGKTLNSEVSRMRRSANRAAPAPLAGRRRLVAATGALVVFGGIIGVTQISSADDQAATTAGKTVNGLEILANDCTDSALAAHDGFQNGGRCVSTEFGEVGAQEKNPTLLITEAPKSVEAGKPFTLKVSTRNLVRDRFLAAGQGGYYVESSVLTGEGLVRGHFHTACRMLSSTSEANDPAPVPAFFVATEDRKGGAKPDEVTIQVPGMPDAGTAQCASWAGDGSHRVPMMQRANQTPAFDAVRIKVRKGEEQPPAEEPPAEEPPAEEPPAEQPPAEQPPAQEEPPAEQPPAEEPPAEQPPAQEEPPAEQPPAEQPPAADAGDDGAPLPPVEKPRTNAGSVKSAAPAKPAARDDEDEDAKPASGGRTSSRTDDEAPAEPQALTGAKNDEKSTGSTPAEETDAPALTYGDDGAPDPDPVPQDNAIAAAQNTDDGKLALTGTSTVAVIGGGLVALLIGFVVVSATRRRRPRTHWHH